MKDYGYEVQDSATFTVSAAGAIGATAKILDWGAGKLHAELVVDVSAIEIASDNEWYSVMMQGSTESDFGGTYTALCAIEIGANQVIDSDLDSAVGRYRLPFTNEQPDGTIYPYGRLYCACGGSISTGIVFSAHVEKPKS